MPRKRLPWNFKTLILYENPIYRRMRFHGASSHWPSHVKSGKRQSYNPTKQKIKLALILFAGAGIIFGLGYTKGYTNALSDSKGIIKEGIEAKAAKSFVRDIVNPTPKPNQSSGMIDRMIDSFLGQ